MFSPTVMDHTHRPRNTGPLDSATHRGVAGEPGEGPYLILEFEIEDGRILKAAYQTYGCPAAIASGSVVAELLIGRTTNQASKLTVEDLTRLLHGVPEGKEHCPQLAILALNEALKSEE